MKQDDEKCRLISSIDIKIQTLSIAKVSDDQFVRRVWRDGNEVDAVWKKKLEVGCYPVHNFYRSLYHTTMYSIRLTPSFKAVYCYICGRWRVAVARYGMICLVHAIIALDMEGSEIKYLHTEEAAGKKLTFGNDIPSDCETHKLFIPCLLPDGMLSLMVRFWLTDIFDPVDITDFLCIVSWYDRCVVVLTRTRHFFQELVCQDCITIYLPLVTYWRWYCTLLMAYHTFSVSLA